MGSASRSAKGSGIFYDEQDFSLIGLIAQPRIGCRAAQIRFQLDPGEVNRQALAAVLAILDEYGETL